MQQPPPGYGPQGYPPPQQGYPPPQGYPPGYGQQAYGQFPPPKKSGLPWYAWAGIAMLVLFGGCLGMCALGIKGAADKQAKEKEDFDKQEAMKVTADEMMSAYKKNEVAGDEKYKGKKLEITGKVHSIDSSIGDAPVVRLGTGAEFEFNTVMLNDLPKADAAKLEKGQSITAVCKGDGEIIGSPVLRDCKLK